MALVVRAYTIFRVLVNLYVYEMEISPPGTALLNVNDTDAPDETSFRALRANETTNVSSDGTDAY